MDLQQQQQQQQRLTRQTKENASGSSARALDASTRARRTQKFLDSLEQDNFMMIPVNHCLRSIPL